MKYFFLFLLIKPLASHADAIPNRRVADLLSGTQLRVQLNDPILLDEKKHEWIKGSAFDGTKCHFSIESHFDRAQAVASGETLYTVTQNNNQNYLSSRGEIRDQFTLVLTTENKNLPLLMFDCFRITMIRQAPDRSLTLGSVEKLLNQPGLFAKPLFSAQATKLAADMAPMMSKIKTLIPLEFSQKSSGRGFTVNAPRFEKGKITKPEESATCRADLNGGPYQGEYSLTLPAGSEFNFEYISSANFSNSNLISFRGNDGLIYFDISCVSKQGNFLQSFADVQKHLAGIIGL